MNVTVSPAASPSFCRKTLPETGSSVTRGAPGVVLGGIEDRELAVEDGDVDLLVLPDVDALVLAPGGIRASGPSPSAAAAFAMAGATMA